MGREQGRERPSSAAARISLSEFPTGCCVLLGQTREAGVRLLALDSPAYRLRHYISPPRNPPQSTSTSIESVNIISSPLATE